MLALCGTRVDVGRSVTFTTNRNLTFENEKKWRDTLGQRFGVFFLASSIPRRTKSRRERVERVGVGTGDKANQTVNNCEMER